MKRILLTLIISFIAIFYTGCDVLEEALADFSGCTLEDAPNYDGSKSIPCATDCINGQTGANCCCEEIIYGCMETTAANYAVPGTDCTVDVDCPNAPCVETISGVETANACCTTDVAGCMEPGANNFNPDATTSDTSCEYNEYGCMDDTACNHNPDATNDCSGQPPADADSQDDACCDMEKNASCYKDLNNNGFYEEVNSSANKCNCGELGVGWVSEDRVAKDPEVMGCMSAIIDGQPCIEYNPNANVNNGSCCQSSFEDLGLTEEQITEIENLSNFAGQYNLEIVYGSIDGNGTCIADTMMMPFGPSISQLTLAANGSLQLYEEYLNSFNSRPEWENHAEDVNNEMACGDKADQQGADYWFCANWGTDDFEVCEDLYSENECNSRQDCHFEKNFCQPTFEGMPCDQIMAEYECSDSNCEWKEDEMGAHCVFPMHEPWMDCIFMSEWECGDSPDCQLADESDDGDDDDYYDDDYDDDYDDYYYYYYCLDDCPQIDYNSDDYDAAMCEWYDAISPENSDCLSDCDENYNDYEYSIYDMIGFLKAIECNADFPSAECEEFMDDYDYYDYGNDDGPPDCVEDCAGIDDHEPEDGKPFCEWIVALDTGCLSDCDQDVHCKIDMFDYMCEACLQFNYCDEWFLDDYDYSGKDSDDVKAKPQHVLQKIGEKLFEKAKLNSNAFARSSGCEVGYVEDCFDGECCPISWIGDGFADCQDQEFGCDLSCFDCGTFGADYLCIDAVKTPEGNDGGDCEGFVALCEPSNPCFDILSQPQCNIDNNCDWIFAEDECHPKPSGMEGGPNCGQYTTQGQSACVIDVKCEWMPPGPNGEPSMCGPKSCNSYSNEDGCNSSSVCAWEPPDWIDPWAVGACMQNNPCARPELQDSGSCDSDPNCAWDWDEWHCVGAGDQQGGFCECLISLTKNTCNAINGATWIQQGDDAYECMVPMEYQDCYYDHQDDCNQFYSDGNQQTYWDEPSHTCTKSFSFAEGGDWYMKGTDKICLNWEEKADPECSTLMSEETCYCFDCEWDMIAHACEESSMGRVTEQFMMHKYQEIIMELSGSGSNLEENCFQFTLVGDMISIRIVDGEEEGDYCEEIVLTVSGS